MTTATIAVVDLSADDQRLLRELKLANAAGEPRPVINQNRDWRQAFTLSDFGFIAMEAVPGGARLHITRLGIKVLHAIEGR